MITSGYIAPYYTWDHISYPDDMSKYAEATSAITGTLKLRMTPDEYNKFTKFEPWLKTGAAVRSDTLRTCGLISFRLMIRRYGKTRFMILQPDGSYKEYEVTSVSDNIIDKHILLNAGQVWLQGCSYGCSTKCWAYLTDLYDKWKSGKLIFTEYDATEEI